MTVASDLLRIHVGRYWIAIDISLWAVVGVLLLWGLVLWAKRRLSDFHKYEVVKVSIALGNVGTVELRPNNEDVQIAHRIWTELVTRKAAQPIDFDNDVIVEIYDSWYALFGRVRQLISDIPGHLLRKEKSTQELVKIATQTLNNGLRPHLTRWQARFRHWYENCSDDLKLKCPQDCEREFPQYKELIADLKTVNQQLIEYAGQLEKIVHGGRTV